MDTCIKHTQELSFQENWSTLSTYYIIQLKEESILFCDCCDRLYYLDIQCHPLLCVGICVSRLYELCKNNNNKTNKHKNCNVYETFRYKVHTFRSPKTVVQNTFLQRKFKHLQQILQNVSLGLQSDTNINLWILFRKSYASPSKNRLFI